jgi:hypothetical protein
MTMTNWPWNVNLTNSICSSPPITYVINGGTFDTTLQTAPPSVGAAGATYSTRIEQTPTGPVTVFSFPSVVITGAVTAIGKNPLVIEACNNIRVSDTFRSSPASWAQEKVDPLVLVEQRESPRCPY